MATWMKIGIVALLLVLTQTTPGLGQITTSQGEIPSAKPQPLSEADNIRRKALKKFALGLIHQKQDHLLAALHAFEDSLAIDPQAIPVYKELVPLYLTFDRRKEAMEACKNVLKISPEDYRVRIIYAKQLRSEGKSLEAIAELDKALKHPDIQKKNDLYYRSLAILADLCEQTDSHESAAEYYFRSGKALESTLSWFKANPYQEEEMRTQCAVLYEKSGKLFVGVKDYANALKAFSQAQKAYPKVAARLNLNLAQVCNAQKNYTHALKFVDAYLRFLPADVDPYELKISLYRKLKREDEIIPWLKKTTKLDKHNLDLLSLLGNEYQRANQPDEAESVYLTLVSKSSKAGYLKQLFELYTKEPRFGFPVALRFVNKTFARARSKEATETSVELARTLLTILREDTQLSRQLVKCAWDKKQLSELEFETLNVLAVLADEGDQPEQAERFYRAALSDVTQDREALVYGGLLRVLWKSHKYSEIINVAKVGLEKADATNRLLFRSYLARAHGQLGEFESALKEADQAIRLATETNRLNIENLKVRLFVLAGRTKDAEKACFDLLKKYEGRGDVLDVRHMLSNVYSESGNFSKSEEQLKLILKADPTNATAFNDLGYLWADQNKNLPEAEKYIRRAIELDFELNRSPIGVETEPYEENAAFIDSLGWVLFRRNKLEEAKKELERATKLPGGEDPVIWGHLGDVYFRMEQKREAGRAWQKALRLYQQNVRKKDHRYDDLKAKIQQLIP